MSRTRGAAALSQQPVPRHPRRVSGPVARPVPVPGQPRSRTPTAQPHSTTLGAKVRALPDHRLLDTLLRSRAWIWLLGIALGGIVFMQVSLLGMNAGIGANVQRAEDLQHSNAALEGQVAELSGLDRVRAQANRLGLISPDAGQVGFLRARPGDARRAASDITEPTAASRETLATDGRDSTVPTDTTASAATTTTGADPVATVAPTAVATPMATATPVYTATAPPATTTTTTAPTTSTSTTGATTAP